MRGEWEARFKVLREKMVGDMRNPVNRATSRFTLLGSAGNRSVGGWRGGRCRRGKFARRISVRADGRPSDQPGLREAGIVQNVDRHGQAFAKGQRCDGLSEGGETSGGGGRVRGHARIREPRFRDPQAPGKGGAVLT